MINLLSFFMMMRLLLFRFWQCQSRRRCQRQDVVLLLLVVVIDNCLFSVLIRRWLILTISVFVDGFILLLCALLFFMVFG